MASYRNRRLRKLSKLLESLMVVLAVHLTVRPHNLIVRFISSVLLPKLVTWSMRNGTLILDSASKFFRFGVVISHCALVQAENLLVGFSAKQTDLLSVLEVLFEHKLGYHGVLHQKLDHLLAVLKVRVKPLEILRVVTLHFLQLRELFGNCLGCV